MAAEGWRAGQIAEILNEEGYRPPKRRERFGAQGIGDLMRRLGLTAEKRPGAKGRDRSLGKDEWWLSRLAAELGMPKVTLYGWVRQGRVKARRGQDPQGRWIVWADQKELKRLRRLQTLPAGYHTRKKKFWVE